MRSRLRSLDSKISFFAFADIITAVSGVLIFVALLLATDLGQPATTASTTVTDEEKQLKEVLAQQMEIDAKNSRLEELLTVAETAPSTEKLQADIETLRSELAQERKRNTALQNDLSSGQSAIAAKDRFLGFTTLQAQIGEEQKQVEALGRKEAKAREEMRALDQQVVATQAKVLQLRQREGQIWLVPDSASTSKEPILVTVSRSGIAIDRFDHPEEHRQAENEGARSALESYLSKRKAVDSFVVFFVRPSGIKLFTEMSLIARAKSFQVGYEALEEDRQAHFFRPPNLDQPIQPDSSSFSSRTNQAGTPIPPELPTTPDSTRSAPASSEGGSSAETTANEKTLLERIRELFRTKR